MDTEHQTPKESLWELLSKSKATPAEVEELLKAVVGGRIEGAKYIAGYPLGSEVGLCGCLLGTLAVIRDKTYCEEMWVYITHTSSILDHLGVYTLNGDQTPFETYLRPVRIRQTPASSSVLANTEAWLLEWLAEAKAKARIQELRDEASAELAGYWIDIASDCDPDSIGEDGGLDY